MRGGRISIGLANLGFSGYWLPQKYLVLPMYWLIQIIGAAMAVLALPALDNLSTTHNSPGPNVSVIRRFQIVIIIKKFLH